MSKPRRPKPPPQLTGRARAWWLEMHEAYEGFDVDPSARELLTSAAVQLQRAEQARKVIEQLGVVYSDRFDRPKENPACTTERAAMNLHRLLIRELGLQAVESESIRLPRLSERYA